MIDNKFGFGLEEFWSFILQVLNVIVRRFEEPRKNCTNLSIHQHQNTFNLWQAICLLTPVL